MTAELRSPSWWSPEKERRGARGEVDTAQGPWAMLKAVGPPWVLVRRKTWSDVRFYQITVGEGEEQKQEWRKHRGREEVLTESEDTSS